MQFDIGVILVEETTDPVLNHAVSLRLFLYILLLSSNLQCQCHSIIIIIIVTSIFLAVRTAVDQVTIVIFYKVP